MSIITFQGKVEVPPPMHIGISESANAGPGDCHIKGGYIEGAATWTVKLANVCSEGYSYETLFPCESTCIT